MPLPVEPHIRLTDPLDSAGAFSRASRVATDQPCRRWLGSFLGENAAESIDSSVSVGGRWHHPSDSLTISSSCGCAG